MNSVPNIPVVLKMFIYPYEHRVFADSFLVV